MNGKEGQAVKPSFLSLLMSCAQACQIKKKEENTKLPTEHTIGLKPKPRVP